MEIVRVFCFPKSRINKNSGKEVVECCFSFTVFSTRYIYRTYNEKGKCTPIGGAHKSSSLRTHNLQKPSRLYWDITPKLAEIIENAVRFAQKVL